MERESSHKTRAMVAGNSHKAIQHPRDNGKLEVGMRWEEERRRGEGVMEKNGEGKRY